jgi:hypothetical protein
VTESIFLLSLSDFYGLHSSQRFSYLAEKRLSASLDRHNALTILAQADRLGARKIKKVVLEYLMRIFHIF